MSAPTLDWDEEDEGWMWLPWEELQEIQREKNQLTRALLDNAKFVSRRPID